MTFALGLVTAGRLGDLVGRRTVVPDRHGRIHHGFTRVWIGAGRRACSSPPARYRNSRVDDDPARIRALDRRLSTRQAAPGHSSRSARSWGWPPSEDRSWPAGCCTINPFGSGWRSIFLVNVPIGIAALVAQLGAYRPVTAAKTAMLRLDLTGVTFAHPRLRRGADHSARRGTRIGLAHLDVRGMMTGSAAGAGAVRGVGTPQQSIPVIGAVAVSANAASSSAWSSSPGFFAAQNGFLCTEPAAATRLALEPTGLGPGPHPLGDRQAPSASACAGAILVARGSAAPRCNSDSAGAAVGLVVLCWTIGGGGHQHLTALALTPGVARGIGFGTGLVGRARSSNTSSAIPPPRRWAPDRACSTPSSNSASAIGFAALGTLFFSRVRWRWVRRGDAGRAGVCDGPVCGHARLGRAAPEGRPGGHAEPFQVRGIRDAEHWISYKKTGNQPTSSATTFSGRSRATDRGAERDLADGGGRRQRHDGGAGGRPEDVAGRVAVRRADDRGIGGGSSVRSRLPALRIAARRRPPGRARPPRRRSWSCTRLASTAPSTETPIAPPSERKNATVAEVAPMSRDVDGVLDGEHEVLHHRAHAEAHQRHEEPAARSGSRGRSCRERPGRR